MAAYVVWMDYREAKLYKLSPVDGGKHQMKLHTHKHANHPHGKHEQHHHPEADHWFHEIAEALKADGTELLLIGAGEAKVRFKHYLDGKYASLAKGVVGTETVDHPTENQLLETARKFFRKYDLYH